MNSVAITRTPSAGRPGWYTAGLLLRPLHLAIAFPSLLFVGTMTVFLFRPPAFEFHNIDRIAFCLLVFFVCLRTLAVRDRVTFHAAINLPMFGLIGLAVLRALREPFDAQTWSLVASKFVVPFALMHIAILVFRNPAERAHFEVFILLTLAYLVFTAIAFVSGAKSLIFPRFILDESIGHHINRARGPFLQAVANGMSLNMLGILALVLVQKHRRIVLLLWLALPLAILATMTRAVWIAFAVSTIALGIRLGGRYRRRVSVPATIAALLALALIVVGALSTQDTLLSRAGERGPLEARKAVYQAGWAMFREHPFTGWTAARMYEELARRMEGYHLRSYFVHNTYLSLLVEFGLPGLLLYCFLLVGLFRLARAGLGGGAEDRAVSNLRRVWPILLGVFLFNACFVDMVYQFVNGLLFTVAGILCAGHEAAA